MSIVLKCNSSRRSTPTTFRRVWMYHNADFSQASDIIRQTDWDSLLSDDLDHSTELWTKKFLDIMKECIPHRDLSLKRCNLPWITKNIIRYMQKRNHLFRKSLQQANPRLREKYKRLRNKVSSMLRSAKKYFKSLAAADNKTFWKTVKLLTHAQVSVPVLCAEGVSAVTDREKADMLNNYFAKCWNLSQPPLSEISSDDIASTDDDNDLLFCSTEETESLLLTLDASKATGPDNISPRMHKETATSIAPSLGKLFNLSISKGYFPHIWKNARVVPIPKSSPAGHASSSYRPISLLSVQSKVLEKHIHFLITEHLNEFHPLSAVQWGFQKGKSTLTALLSSTHDWLTELDRNKDVCCVFFDFQKAFDTVPHRNLIKRLEDLNLHPLLLKGTSSYLMNRSQHVVVDGSVSSESTTVISGVLQGSVLGPLLFLIYIDSITSVPLSEGSKISLYADDMMLYKPISSSVDLTNLQKDVDSIFEWSCSNFMVFNVTKCKSMLLSCK